jgi:hypothetical protein
MTPIVQLYLVRVVLALVAAALSAVVAFVLGNLTDISTLVNCISIALLIYLVSFYPIKAVYKNKIEKQSKILSTAIGMYFFTWIAFFILFFTIIQSVA